MDSINGFVWSRKEKVSDKFCWTCHRSEPSLFCATCVRSFHESPVCSHSKKMTSEAMQLWRCPDCIGIEKDAETIAAMPIDVVYVNKLLKFVSNLLQEDEYLTPHFQQIVYAESVANAMDFHTIAKKIERNSYRCWEEFLADIKWITHNTKAWNKPKTLAHTATDWLMKFTREELCSIRLCHECYKNANEHPDEWSTMICEAKHPVVWAKVATYPYWPAKLLEFDSDKAVVQFFGEKSRSTVSAHDCLKYTKDCPSIQIGQHKDALERAKMAATMYIDNLIAKCGTNVMLNEKIPKPISVRRQTISARKCNKPILVAPSITGSGRILKRRSTLLSGQIGINITNGVNHRQCKQFALIKSMRRETLTDAPNPNVKKDLTHECGAVLESLAKKPKLLDDSISNGAPAHNVSANQNDDFVEKNEEPVESSLPITQFNPNHVSYQDPYRGVCDTANDMRNQMDALNSSSVEEMEPNQTITASKPCDLPAKSEIKSDDKRTSSTPTPTPNEQLSHDLISKYKQIVDKTMQNKLREWKQERSDYDHVINGLRATIHQLKIQCEDLNSQNFKLRAQNLQLTNTGHATKVENGKLKVELQAANDKIANLHSNLNAMVHQNAAMQSKMSELRNLSDERSITVDSHQKLIESLAKLHVTSQEMASNGKEFNAKCQQMKMDFLELDRLRVQNQQQTQQLIYIGTRCDQVISNVKRRTWCASCGVQIPGVIYNCNQCSLAKLTSVNRCGFGQR